MWGASDVVSQSYWQMKVRKNEGMNYGLDSRGGKKKEKEGQEAKKNMHDEEEEDE